MGLRQQLLSQSSIIFAARMFGAGLIFLAQAAITRLWGAESLGEYLLIIAAANIIGVILPLGFETIGTYFAAEYRAGGEGRLLRGFVMRAYGHVVALMAVLVVGGPYVVGLLGPSGQVLLSYWWPLCIMTFGNALALVAGALLVGLKRPFATFFSDSLFRTALIILSFPVALLALTDGGRFELLVWLVSFAYLVVGIGLTGYLLHVMRELPMEAEPRRRESRRWWRFALPWGIIVLATDYFFDFDLLFLAGIMGKEELAIFGVCARIFVLVSFGLTAVYAVTMPEIMESSSKEGILGNEAFLKRVGDTNLAASVIALVIVAGVAVGSPLALMLFGEEFLAGSVPLAVMSICLVVRAVMGPAALALSIHDRPYTTLPAVGAGIATLVSANTLLVPAMGLLGAAIAAMLAQSVWAIAMWWTAWRVTKVDVSLLPRLRQLLEARRQAAVRNG